ncbi:neutral zinc metallopeptidase [Allokutzneria oryzae]|uniref:Neutral zinc metallopeptidase n=1 Tax=Allokutzneria oryzae TaxID=1378989 RepID=A0ABV6A2N3_9PSEU
MTEPVEPPLEDPTAHYRRRGNSPLVITLVVAGLLAGTLGFAGLARTWGSEPDIGDPGLAGPLTSTSRAPEDEKPMARPKYRLADHPLLAEGLGLGPTDCELPAFGRTAEQLHDYYAAGLKCLEAAWSPVLQATNLPVHQAKLDTSPDLPRNPCGEPPNEDEAIAMYCGANFTIYMPITRLQRNYGSGKAAASGHLATLAHEYGHHVQAVSGMLSAANRQQIDAGESTPAGRETSRRIEMQATCFAGMFFAATSGRGSVTKSLADNGVADFRRMDDTSVQGSTHGKASNQAAWAKRGHKDNRTASCNTWTASSAEVS